jgi:hypothetical protein
MQTFLPYADIGRSLESLERYALWRQVIEASQLIHIVEQGTGPFIRHPFARMWKRDVNVLIHYYNYALLTALTKYKIKMLMRYETVDHPSIETVGGITRLICKPVWLGDEALHSSHRSRLLQTDAEFYSQYGWKDDPRAPMLRALLCIKRHQPEGCSNCGGRGYLLKEFKDDEIVKKKKRK